MKKKRKRRTKRSMSRSYKKTRAARERNVIPVDDDVYNILATSFSPTLSKTRPLLNPVTARKTNR